MVVRIPSIEFTLIAVGLVLAFGYLAFRAVIWDNFVWIVAVPIIASLFLLAVHRRHTRFRPNTLDRIVIAYCIYGIGMAAIGILFLESSKFVVVKGLVHYYAPVALYFIARSYTRNSPDRPLVVTRIIWVLAALFILDFFIENYIVGHLGSGLAIPWVQNEISKMGDISARVLEQYTFERVSTVFVGGKRPGFVAATLFVTILPFLLHEVRKNRSAWHSRSWQFNTLLTTSVLGGLAFTMIRLNNKTALFAAILVLVIGLLSLRSIRKIVTVTVLLAIGLFFTYDTLYKTVQTQFFVPHAYDRAVGAQMATPFEYITNPATVVYAYRDADPYAFFFGAQLLGSDIARIRQITPTSFASSELRGTGLPIFFGFGWALIVGATLSTMLVYSLRLIKSVQFRFFGLSMIGLIVVYAADLHYPSSITHGPLEMFMVMTGVLSSLSDTSRKPSNSKVREETTEPSRSQLRQPSARTSETGRLRPRPTETA
ncbi:MAG: hypothetical protein QGI49_04240 [SAR202 cluster bacterium]|nr:hypothetical protein [SAR202 cluster bacterium]